MRGRRRGRHRGDAGFSRPALVLPASSLRRCMACGNESAAWAEVPDLADAALGGDADSRRKPAMVSVMKITRTEKLLMLVLADYHDVRAPTLAQIVTARRSSS